MMMLPGQFKNLVTCLALQWFLVPDVNSREPGYRWHSRAFVSNKWAVENQHHVLARQDSAVKG